MSEGATYRVDKFNDTQSAPWGVVNRRSLIIVARCYNEKTAKRIAVLLSGGRVR